MDSKSEPSMAIAKPRTGCAGEEDPGGGNGGEIFARTRILFKGWIDMTMASTDFARVDAGESRVVGEVFRGGNLRDVSGLERPLGLGGGPMLKLFF